MDEQRPPGELLGRGREIERLARLIELTHQGQSGVLVLLGEAGVGKTALVDHVVRAASGVRVLRAVGVEWEMELPFAALQQLCAPVLDRLEGLPGPQQAALRTAFGLSDGAPPDRLWPTSPARRAGTTSWRRSSSSGRISSCRNSSRGGRPARVGAVCS